ncbi:MAG TPA: GDSL-type esterase/lipase family protein [Thermoanaerobaculia bacterium]|nr:GDSL-type esterase/lipase family protein [Thermoanaerobaculia bacterium]
MTKFRAAAGRPYAYAVLAGAALLGCTAEEAPGVTLVQTETRAAARAPLRQVVLIGDSLAYGTGDESGKGIAGWLDDELRRRGVRSLPTVNLGVNGATTADVASRLNRADVRDAIARADAVVLSVGANDLVRVPGAREEALRAPFIAARKTLDRVAAIVGTILEINPDARVLILGGYNPFPQHPYAPLVGRYLAVWDESVIEEFEAEPRVAIVRMSDIVRAERLSSYDRFHPGKEAYRVTAHRIAGMLLG